MYLWVIPEELDALSDSPFALEACQMASFILYAFSGRKYTGTVTVTETYECPCRTDNSRDMFPSARWGSTPVLVAGGGVANVMTGDCGCGTLAHTRLRLRGRPVRGIHRVVVGGITLDPGNYRLVNYSTLQAAPGGSFDPCGATVTYSYGAEPPIAGRRAARNLATELAKGWSGDEECRLPDRITSISRQGISYTVLDQQDFLEELRTGIYAVDLFLRAVNPDRARRPARILSPDMPKVIRSTPVPEAPREHDLVITRGSIFSWEMSLEDLNATYLATEPWELAAQIVSFNGYILHEYGTPNLTLDSAGEWLTLSLSAIETSAIAEGGIFELYAINSEGPTIISLFTSTAFST